MTRRGHTLQITSTHAGPLGEIHSYSSDTKNRKNRTYRKDVIYNISETTIGNKSNVSARDFTFQDMANLKVTW